MAFEVLETFLFVSSGSGVSQTRVFSLVAIIAFLFLVSKNLLIIPKTSSSSQLSRSIDNSNVSFNSAATSGEFRNN